MTFCRNSRNVELNEKGEWRRRASWTDLCNNRMKNIDKTIK